MDPVWLRMESMGVKIGGKEILHDISLEIRAGEQWAVFGEAGSGKTVWAHTLAGSHAFSGSIDFPDRKDIPLEKNVLVIDQQHRFRDLQNQSNFYYQQRYNSFDAEATITVRKDLSGMEGNDQVLSKTELLDIFHLTTLLDEPLIQLSNGENKRIQILKAVLRFPYLLILDEPFTGLDTEGRQLLDGILEKLSLAGQRLLLFTSRDHLPGCFNRQTRIHNGTLASAIKEKGILSASSAPINRSIKDFPSSVSFTYPEFQYAVRMHQVHVRYEEKNILEGIDWDLPKGGRCVVAGHNGAGKSTLLSLITADNPQAYANEIYLFDRKRGTGESIWEIKQKTGFLSPELQLYFDPSSTAFTALASGLFDTIGLFRSLSARQEKLVMEWLEFLDCTNHSHRLLSSLPMGVQRLILLGRAMIKTPPLLVLDEPCQGLDASQTGFAINMIDRYCRFYRATLIYVSHYTEDYPPNMDQILRLHKGRIYK
jgi:molybdate transport system ATP-binding protein